MYFHFGELPGFNSFSGYDPGNKVTVVMWSNLTVAPDSRPTANVLLLKVLDQINSLPSQAPPSAAPTTR
jgi:D-alanyl-D-alanine carboxypeptidase